MTTTKHSTMPPQDPSVAQASASASDWGTDNTMSRSTARAVRPVAMFDLPLTFFRVRTTTQGLRSIKMSSRLTAQVQHFRMGWRKRVIVAADIRLSGSRSLISKRATNFSICAGDRESARAEWDSNHACPARWRSVIVSASRWGRTLACRRKSSTPRASEPVSSAPGFRSQRRARLNDRAAASFVAGSHSGCWRKKSSVSSNTVGTAGPAGASGTTNCLVRASKSKPAAKSASIRAFQVCARPALRKRFSHWTPSARPSTSQQSTDLRTTAPVTRSVVRWLVVCLVIQAENVLGTQGSG